MDAHISLPADLKDKLEHEARVRGMSVADFVRTFLERAIARKPLGDPLFADTAVYRDDGPENLASDHDDCLYGDAP